MPDNKQFFIRVSGQLVPVSEEIFMAYHRSKRRDRYFEQDIKMEPVIHDGDGSVVGFAPSKEDSLERLYGIGVDFIDGGDSVEDRVVQLLMLDKLHAALAKLTPEERALIETLFFSNGGDGISLRKYAELSGIPHMTVQSRKLRIIERLRKLILN